MNVQRFRFLAFFAAVLIISLSGCAYVQVPLFTPVQPMQEKVLEGQGDAKILLVEVSGVISEQEKQKKMGFTEDVSLVAQIKEELQKAEKDKAISGILLKIDSPGGTVTASDMIYHELIKFKKRTGKHITACIMGLGTSGGYYIACAADEIIAHPTALTGSIGVIAMKMNVHGLMEKIGIRNETFKSGDKKDILSPFRATSPEEFQIMQTIINQLHKRFVDVIADGRNGTLKRNAVEKLADGRIYTADQALENKLIDKVGYLDDAIAHIKNKLNLKEAKIIVYLRPGSYKGSIYSSYPASTMSWPMGANLLPMGSEIFSSAPQVKFMYLWSPW
ncbi:MAG: signal peptide peptidase SppA [Syntrophales bacterium]